jgi:hypothetical protein
MQTCLLNCLVSSFEETCSLVPEDKYSSFLRNVDDHLLECTHNSDSHNLILRRQAYQYKVVLTSIYSYVRGRVSL